MTIDADTLPASWAVTTLGEVADINPSGTTITAKDDEPVTFLPMAAIEELSGHVDLSRQRAFGEVKKGFTRFRDGDLLFAKITPCMENGKTAVVRGLLGGIGCGSTEFHVLRSAPGVHADYLRYFVVRSTFRQEARRNMQGAVGQQRVPVDFLRGSELPLAPTTEQQRIVSKVDELFSRIDEGERALERVQKLVERYRQSVLKAAVTGELTRDWREKNKGPLEPGEALLARILKARRTAWESAELAKMKAKGVKPANDKWKQKYEEPSPPDTSGLPELPRGWVWAAADAVCESVHSGTTPERDLLQATVSNGIPFIKVYNLTMDGTLDFTIDPTYVDLEHHRRKMGRSRTLPGDVLTNIVGPPLGKVSVVPPAHEEWNINQAVAAFRPLPGLLGDILSLYLQSAIAKAWLNATTKTTTSQVNLAITTCRRLPVPIPPLAEQTVLGDSARRALSNVEAVAVAVRSLVSRATALRQSVLKSAFCGGLISQVPSDEPASVLLERIASVRLATPAKSKPGQKKIKQPA